MAVLLCPPPLNAKAVAVHCVGYRRGPLERQIRAAVFPAFSKRLKQRLGVPAFSAKEQAWKRGRGGGGEEAEERTHTSLVIYTA